MRPGTGPAHPRIGYLTRADEAVDIPAGHTRGGISEGGMRSGVRDIDPDGRHEGDGVLQPPPAIHDRPSAPAAIGDRPPSRPS